MSERSQIEQTEAGNASVEVVKQENSSTNNITENENTNKSEPVDLDNPIAQALLRKAHKNGPLLSIGKENNSSARCNICECPKSRNQPWEEHNTSERHISALIDKRGFNSALNELTKLNAKFITIQCDLCDTVFKNALYFQIHKNCLEHKRRYRELLKLVELAVNLKQNEAWSKITKPPKVTAKDVSRTLKALRKKW